MMGPNRVIIAAAGSGKTSHLVREALRVKDGNVLITTYTDSNEAEIKQRIIETNGYIPSNIVVMTWFSFLISHGVKPFQGGLFKFAVRGMQLCSNRSGFRALSQSGRPMYWGEEDFEKFYFNSSHAIYSDKLSKLAMRCNQTSDGSVIDRISRVFRHIFVDEVQDLAGYDLDILAALFRSPARVLLVGDPRQVTYLTHHEARNKKYTDGRLVDFFRDSLPKKVPFQVDEDTLSTSHRNNAAICALASKLYPKMKPTSACACSSCRDLAVADTGIFIVQPAKYEQYMATYKPMQLRDRITSTGVDERYPAMNFGESKGRGFDRVLIHPTQPMLAWMRNSEHDLKSVSRAKFYVALTRARYSVAVLAEWTTGVTPPGISVYR